MGIWDFSDHENPRKIGSGGSGSGFLGYQIHPLNPSVVFSSEQIQIPHRIFLYFDINLHQFAIQINHQMYKLITFTNPMGSIFGIPSQQTPRHRDLWNDIHSIHGGPQDVPLLTTNGFNGYKGGVKIATVPSVLKMFF